MSLSRMRFERRAISPFSPKRLPLRKRSAMRIPARICEDDAVNVWEMRPGFGL